MVGGQNADIADQLQLRDIATATIVKGSFVKRFALCYRSVVCLSCLSVCPDLSLSAWLWCWCILANRLDRSR